ncbi:hypothetical protein [Psychromonas ingrahamii]|uniref:hypothetical protein n=1 Tax=Psychromonas ingrahamii TaxID=357794 RepID=UPI0005A06F9E|nr:hypothetical protein [Psychromonas ingrahamii]
MTKIKKYLTLLTVLLSPISASAGLMYWNVFNIEGESREAAQIVTYSSLLDMLDMLADFNRTSDNYQ